VQGQGLSWVLYGLSPLALFARDGFRPKWISNVTQVPAVFGMVCETFADVFASPQPSARQSFAHLQLARGVMRLQRSVFGIGDEAGFDEHASMCCTSAASISPARDAICCARRARLVAGAARGISRAGAATTGAAGVSLVRRCARFALVRRLLPLMPEKA
jgi:hypothetical protein